MTSPQVALMRWVASLPSAESWEGHDVESPRETAWRLGCDTGRATQGRSNRHQRSNGPSGQDGTPKTGTDQISAKTRESA